MMKAENLLFYVLLAIGAAAIIKGGGQMTYSSYKQRGIRNNNPGNLEYNQGIQWQGQTGTDGRFAVFSDALFGIRALAKTLKTHQTKYGLNTISGIINRWAPPIENNTTAYIAAVAKAVGKTAYTPLTADDYPKVIAAIIKQENGINPYPADLIKQAYGMA